MRTAAFALVMCIATGAQAQSASQACLIVNGLDTLHGIQTRLSRNPDTILFADDVRVLRATVSNISNRAALDAIQSNTLAIKGNTFLRFLQNTRDLLQAVSLDDPNRITPHFTRQVRTNLENVENYLVDLRCTDDEISAAKEAALEIAQDIGGDDDAGQIIRDAADELMNLRNLFWFIGLGIIAVVGTHVGRRLAARRRRRAKRHITNYATDYCLDARTKSGRLIDINCFGTKLRHAEDEPIPKGTSIDICIDDAWLSGAVMWSNAHYAGVQFNRTISLNTVRHICQSPAGGSQKQNGALSDAVLQNQ